jgi:hypothetical protein
LILEKEESPIYHSPSVEKNVSICSTVPATHSYCTSFKQFTCDQRGAELSIDDIMVTIPPGAIPSGTVHIEMGVAMYGPFKFPKNYRPVSPILWFCIKELDDVELSLPIEYKIPHIMTEGSDVKLVFAKATHSISVNTGETFLFELLCNSESHFTYINPLMNKCGYGHLSSKHCCYYCIAAEVKPHTAMQGGFCLHTLIKEDDDSIVLLCTYFLNTCIKVRM